MFAQIQHQPRSRGIVLVLVLAMLGLLALVGVTFATFAGQSRINARNFAQSLIVPQDDELMDFALSQLINDTGDPRSAIRGHSMARDMYGNDAYYNGYLQNSPTTGAPPLVTAISGPTAVGTSILYTVTTNIASNDYNFYPFNFARWLMRVAGTTATNTPSSPPLVSQTFEIVNDSGFSILSTAPPFRKLTIAIGPTDGQLIYNQTNNNQYVPVTSGGTTGTSLYNPTTGTQTLLPGQLVGLVGVNGISGLSSPFTLDGRWLRAFNGTGMGSAAMWGNFRYNGALVSGNMSSATSNSPGNPSLFGMDEDYDACDLENWFLAIQSADGQVMIPSFHRPAAIRYDPSNTNAPANDWQNINPYSATNPVTAWADSASRILRPRNYDGNSPISFPDLVPSTTNGQITYDVDNDGDGITDSVWLDLGYPVRRDSRGQLYKPLFAFMVIGLNGRIPLNTAGNLAGTATGATVAYDGSNNAITFGGGGEHASHLGNSISEVDPTYGLQNGYDGTTNDPTAAFSPPQTGIINGTNTYTPSNSQVDNMGIDVRLTQLRNILAGTRPQTTRTDTTGNVNGDVNYLYYSTSASGEAQSFYMPNGICDNLGSLTGLTPTNPTPGSVDVAKTDPNNGMPYLVRYTLPVAGRWGEAQSVPGVPFPDPLASVSPQPSPTPPGLVGVVAPNWSSGPTMFTLNGGVVKYQIPNGNNVRAGYSMDIGDIVNGLPRDAADDNFNSFDPYPLGHTGELGDQDYYDSAGALLLPVERVRRWLVPADINGTGSITTWFPGNRQVHRGPDAFGRVEYSSYFRPPGAPGAINVNYTAASGVASANNGTIGAIVFPESSSGAAAAPDPFYAITPSNQYPAVPSTTATAPFTPYAENPTYVPDLTNNPLHGFESFRFPNQNYPAASPAFTPQQLGGSPVDESFDPNTFTPTAYPSYDGTVNADVHSDGLNEADEMNLYSPSPLLDSPFGPGDIEWLYRQQDVDGASLTSRLSTLAPVSFTNGLDGQRRRRLFALDAWDTNNFVWANDNPGNSFPTNSTFTSAQSPSFSQLSSILSAAAGSTVYAGTPTLAHRDKKINLNYPLPISNDPNEPIRQKWINDTYSLLKAILPPKAVDTPEELAQLSQFVINIIDFRDPDCTMTHWVNPDVVIAGVPAPATSNGTTTATVPTTAATLVAVGSNPTNPLALDQYGMEYNPVAINEVLAYSYAYYNGGNQRANRFFAELISTLTSPELSTQTPSGLASSISTYYNSALNLGGYQYLKGDPYSGGTWDVVFTADDAYSRPDPYRGQLLPYGNTYGLTPLSRDSFNASPVATDVQLLPLGSGAAANPSTSPPTPANPTIPLPAAATATAPATNYFYAFGNVEPAPANYDQNGPAPSLNWSPIAAPASGSATSTTWATNGQTPVTLVQTLQKAFDPVNGTNVTPSAPNSVLVYEGVLPAWVGPTPTAQDNPSTTTQLPPNYSPTIPAPTGVNAQPIYYWMCLRRPANPFAPVSASNPMVVVDSMRFPYIEGTGNMNNTPNPPLPGGPPSTPTTSGALVTTGNTVYSAQRFQPYRGGHAVPIPQTAPIPPIPLDTRYGYSEQIVVPSSAPFSGLASPANLGASQPGTIGVYYYTSSTSNGTTTYTYYYATQQIYHTIGWANEFEQGSSNLFQENWDLFPFNDRDFTSVAELMLVPGCSPGLFTKQFVDFAPSYANITNIFSTVLPLAAPPTQKPIYTTPTLPTTTTSNLQAYLTGSTPLQVQTGYPATSATAPSTPIQPHTYPYLIDKFYYSGYGQSNTLDPGSQVGGYAADGWFKMFEFLEVPSQMIGAIGPVASGVNFDWMRQDVKPGLLNLNLIVDEEVFFSVAGQQIVNQQNGQYVAPTTPASPPTLNTLNPSDQFTQRLLNFDQITLPLTATSVSGVVTSPIQPGNYTATGGTLPLAAGSPPIPMVVTSTQYAGGAASAYPMFDITSNYSAANLDNDPINNYFTQISSAGYPAQYTPNLKAAWVQFLTARHGGSGYVFGFGSGAVGQSVANSGFNNNTAVVGGALPADRPFHSLSYPDIDLTIMRPAALPPGVTVDSAGNATYYTVPNAYPLPTTTAAALYGSGAPGGPGVTAPWNNPSTYGNATAPLWNTFVGDPGVRNYFLYAGYPTANYPGTPLPAPAGATAPTSGYWPVYPPPIPLRRLFQVPDAYNNASNLLSTPTGGVLSLEAPTIEPSGTATVPASVSPSNASETGDPTINMVAVFNNPVTAPIPAAGALPSIMYTTANGGTTYSGVLTNSVVNLYWPTSYATTTPGTAAAATIITTGTATAVPMPTGVGNNVYYGVGGPPASPDNRQHPLWRIEQLQHLMNLTTTRTHQYAVWVTVGFFEVTKQGDLGMLSSPSPQLAFDTLGSEVGAVTGSTVRYRGFFLVDRTKLAGFNPNNTGSFRQAVVYRKVIQ